MTDREDLGKELAKAIRAELKSDPFVLSDHAMELLDRLDPPAPEPTLPDVEVFDATIDGRLERFVRVGGSDKYCKVGKVGVTDLRYRESQLTDIRPLHADDELRDSPNCLGCGKPLTIDDAWMYDGCPCNSPDGCNDLNRTRWKLLGDLQQRQARVLENDANVIDALEAERDELRAKVKELERRLQRSGEVRAKQKARIAELEAELAAIPDSRRLGKIVNKPPADRELLAAVERFLAGINFGRVQPERDELLARVRAASDPKPIPARDAIQALQAENERLEAERPNPQAVRAYDAASDPKPGITREQLRELEDYVVDAMAFRERHGSVTAWSHRVLKILRELGTSQPVVTAEMLERWAKVLDDFCAPSTAREMRAAAAKMEQGR